MNRASHSAFVSLLVLVLIWAYSWIVMKQVMSYAGPFDFAALRYSAGAVVLLSVMFIKHRSLKPPPLKLTIAVGLAQTTAFQALAQWALVSGGAGHVSLLSYTMPFWVVLLAWWLLNEKPTSRQLFGVLLAAFGLLCVMQPWEGMGTLKSAFLAILGGVAWALATVLSKRMFQLHAPSPLSFTAWQMVFGAAALCIIAALVPSRPIDWSPVFIFGLAYSVFLATSVAWLLWAFVVEYLPTTVAGLSSLGVPVTVVLMAWVLLGEKPNGFEWAGVVLIVAGLVTINRPRRHK